MTRYVLLGLIAIVAAGVLLTADGPSRAASPHFDTAVVRLYSGGEVVGEWRAVGPGRMEGGTFVFPIRKGVDEVEVRIHGTFSVEPSS